MPTSAYDDLRIPFGRTEIERHDPLAEQGNDLFVEGGGEGLAPLAGRLSTPSRSSARLTVDRYRLSAACAWSHASTF